MKKWLVVAATVIVTIAVSNALLGALAKSPSAHAVVDDSTKLPIPANFFERTYLGGSMRGSGNRKPLFTTGDKVVRIAARYRGKPVVGLELRMRLNDRGWSPAAITNAEGIAAWHIPDGLWKLSFIETVGWKSKPPGDQKYFLLNGEERPLGSGKYSSGENPVTREGKALVLGGIDVAPSFTLTITRAINIGWPKDRTGTPSDVGRDAIRWSAAYGADKYLLMIWYDIDGDPNHSFDLASEVVTDKTAFPLSDFHLEKSGRMHTYFVEVKAFDKHGRVVGLSTRAGIDDSPSFSITGQKIIGGFPDFACKCK